MRTTFCLAFIWALFLLTIAPELRAQTFTTIYNFSATNYDAALGYPGMTNSDGASPLGALILSGNTLYGTASLGGTYGFGTLFAINTNGTSFTNFYNFTDNTDGADPDSALILSGANLYGSTPNGGYDGEGGGTVFVINTNGTGFTTLHAFTTSPYTTPEGGLTLFGGNLYAVADSVSAGVFFGINTNDSKYSVIVDFTSSQGLDFNAALISAGTNLYGTAMEGGPYNYGTIFRVNTNGSTPTLLHGFKQGTGSWPHIINSDGAFPIGALVLSGNILYGTTSSGGSAGNGSVFAVNTNGLSFTNLYSFSAINSSDQNNDGANPQSSLVLSRGILYGTAAQGGAAGYGTVFAINTNGTGFTVVHTFTGTNDGATPVSGLIIAGHTLYGTTSFGGTNGNGTLFSLTLPSPPMIVGLNFSGTNLVINAYEPSAGTYATLMSTNPLLPFSQWTPVATNILSAGGNFSITNTVDPNLPQAFYVLQAQ